MPMQQDFEVFFTAGMVYGWDRDFLFSKLLRANPKAYRMPNFSRQRSGLDGLLNPLEQGWDCYSQNFVSCHFLTSVAASPLLICAGVTRRRCQRIIASVLYFSMSPINPEPRVCLPPVQTPPSTSSASFCSGHAKSSRHLRGGANRYSATGVGIRKKSR